MELVYIITKKDVGLGVFNNRFGSKERTLLVSIHHKFGGIGPKDIGVSIYRSSCGQLVWGRLIEKGN